MNYHDQVAVLTITHAILGKFVLRDHALEIAACADARITELETAITVRDTEIARLETDLELARVDQARYRWLRDSDNEGPISAGNATAFGEYGFERVEWFYDDELDAAVDEARAAMGVGDAIGLLPH